MSDRFIHGYALLIGVGHTLCPRWSLPVTVKDVNAIKHVLTDINFCSYPDDLTHLRLLSNQSANYEAILDGLNWLKKCSVADPDATIIIYYSGHGALDLSSNSYYLLQHDFDPQSITTTAISAQILGEKLFEIKAKRLWVIIDSCHAEGMASAKDNLPTGFFSTALPKGAVDSLKQGDGRAVFTSSRGNQSSWIRPDGKPSIYTHHLIEALKGASNQPGDSFVTLGNVMTHLGRTVSQSAEILCQAKQTPFFDTVTEDFPIAFVRGDKKLSNQFRNSELQGTISEEEVIFPALERAKRALSILEEQAASFGIRIPVDLQIELEEKRKQVSELKAKSSNI